MEDQVPNISPEVLDMLDGADTPQAAAAVTVADEPELPALEETVAEETVEVALEPVAEVVEPAAVEEIGDRAVVDNRPPIPKQSIEVHGKWTMPLPDGKVDPTKEQLAMPSDYYDRLQSVIGLLEDRNSRLTKTLTNANQPWLEDLAEGAQLVSLDNGYIESTTRAGSHFTNHPDETGRSLRPGYPKLPKGTSKPQGNDAVRLLSKLMGRGPGMPFTFPLWHTGIWMTVEAPSELSILELHRMLSTEMRDLGNATYGYVFSNYRCFTTKRLVDFVLDHLHGCSLATNEDLRTIISVHDIESMLYGIVCAIYPNGFQYTRSCTANPEVCKAQHEEVLNLYHLLEVDKNALTESQLDHMRKVRKDSMTIEEVRNYQSQHTVMSAKPVSLMQDAEGESIVDITLRVPTIAEHIDSGNSWVTDMSDIITIATEDTLDEDSRRNYMINSSKATIMRQYGHMVDQLKLGDNLYHNKGTSPEAKSDKETIAKTLSSLSADDEVMRKFLSEVTKYNSSTAVAVVGIPTYDCPACSGENASGLTGAFTNLIPLDMFQTFFGLLVQKVQRIRIR